MRYIKVADAILAIGLAHDCPDLFGYILEFCSTRSFYLEGKHSRPFEVVGVFHE
jgi:hypothetical protein